MVDESIISSIKKYLSVVTEHDIHVLLGVIFGSHANGNIHEWSDIDLIVVAPEFDPPRQRRNVEILWELTAETDSRIEPIACGVKQWEEDDSSAIIDIARREGVIIYPTELQPEEVA